MRYAVCIEWDTDGDEELAASLPSRIPIPDSVPDDMAGDYISNITGFCHYCFVLTDTRKEAVLDEL